jgi:ketosteroid isomerase-like protein
VGQGVVGIKKDTGSDLVLNFTSMMKGSKNVRLVLDVLRDEIRGDVAAALEKLTKDYSMTWVYKTKKELFPSTKQDVRAEMGEVYPIKGRQYEIKNIAEGKDVVMVELVESYPDPKTSKVYRTPLVLVLEMKQGKIRTGRHYCDPAVSFLHLSKSDVGKAFKKSNGPVEVLK